MRRDANLGKVNRAILVFPAGRAQATNHEMDPLFAAELPYLRILAMRFFDLCHAAGIEPDDLAQETILHASRAKNVPSDSSHRRRWLREVMANLASDLREKATAAKRGGGKVASLEETISALKDSTLRLEMLLCAPGSGPRTKAQRGETRDRLSAAIDKLPPEQRTAITLHLVHDLTLAETAEAMQRSVDSVRGLVERGRASLREDLSDLWDER